MNNEISVKVKELLLESIKKKIEVENDTDLLKEHILDSISFVDLVNKLEVNYGISYGVLEMSVDRFESINMIVEGVENKLKQLEGIQEKTGEKEGIAVENRNLKQEVLMCIVEKLGIEECDVTDPANYDLPIFEANDEEGIGFGLDSVDVIEVMIAINDGFGIKIGNDEVENLGTVSLIADFIEKKLS